MESYLTAALDKTFEVLGSSRNEAAVPVLIDALNAAEGSVFNRALQSLAQRRNRSGHMAAINRWNQLTDEQREILDEGRGKMSSALRDALLSDDRQLFQNACDIMVRFHEFDLISALVNLAEDKEHPHAHEATDLVLQMVSQLSEMVHGNRDPNDRRDPTLLRKRVMESLERSVERFRTHQRSELIEAFVVLGGTSCNLLRGIIDDPHHACYMTVVQTLSTSDSIGVLKLLLSFLESEHTSLATLTVISRRSDAAFLGLLFKFVGKGMSPKVRKNLRRIRSFPWLEERDFPVSKLDEDNQAHCIELLAASGADDSKKLDVYEDVLRQGATAGRVAACEALKEITGDRSNILVLEFTKDEDPQVQAAVASQLRDRHIAGTMSLLVQLLDSPHEVVREAARESLSEFTLENYLSQFDTLHDDSRKTTGNLVRKVDLNLASKLQAEMQSQSRRTACERSKWSTHLAYRARWSTH